MGITINKDNIFSDEQLASSGFLSDNDRLRSFAFNSSVAQVFDDMVSRSVPGYNKIQEFNVKFCLQNIVPSSSIYDIGTATATTLITLANIFKTSINKQSDFPKLIGIDSSSDMIERSLDKINAYDLNDYISLIESKIEEVDIFNASLVLSNFTIQFLEPNVRYNVVKNIFRGLQPDGYFILSEKIKHNEPNLQNFQTESYYAFKKSNGYSEAEINRKREALENVLIPFTISENIEMLKSCGFKTVDIIFTDLVFCCLVAKK